jgi:hypothetical protein
VHHPFQSGDRIPDRTYVVAKALARDDARDVRLDPSSATGITGFVQGLRQNLTGGVFPFVSQAAAVGAQPTWGAGVDGWYGDTLGFLTAPRSYMTINMQGIDEHGRRDGTPAALGFDVGHEPCLQCIELLPRPDTSVPAFDNSVPCVEDTSAAYLAGHPCLGGVTQLRVSPASAGGQDPARDLQMVPGTAYMLVNRASGIVTNTVTSPSRSDSVSNHVLTASRYRYAVVFNGMDDPRESWPQAARRIGGVAYRVSSACDPGNTIRDGIGSDNLEQPTWGQPATGTGLVISPIDGTWKFEVDVFVPSVLLQTRCSQLPRVPECRLCCRQCPGGGLHLGRRHPPVRRRLGGCRRPGPDLVHGEPGASGDVQLLPQRAAGDDSRCGADVARLRPAVVVDPAEAAAVAGGHVEPGRRAGAQALPAHAPSADRGGHRLHA